MIKPGSFSDPDIAEEYLRGEAARLGWAHPQHVIVMDARFAADLLGSSYQYIRRLARNGRIPSWRPNGPRGNWRFSVRALACWLAGVEPPPSPKEFWRPDPEYDNWLAGAVEGLLGGQVKSTSRDNAFLEGEQR